MTFLPIVERELRVAARLTVTYRNRTLVAGAVTAVAVIVMLFGSLANSPARVGGMMFQILAYLALIFCLLEGVRKTADCLSEEKREGTLGLLFLTDLKGYDVILGKLAATSLNSIYGLLSTLPVLALPLLMGGVTPGEFWRVVLALANALFFSLCVGIWISSRSRQENRAMAGTLLVVGLFVVLPLLSRIGVLFQFSPFFAFETAFATVYPRSKEGYFWSLVLTQLISWSLLFWAASAVPRSWQEGQACSPWSNWQPWQFGDPSKRAESRAQMLEINPALWLAGRNLAHRNFLLLLIAVAGICSAAFVLRSNSIPLPVFVALAWSINFALKIRLAAQAAHCLAEARQNNALEMLLATPLTVDEIIHGQILALKRIFQVPIIIILSLEAAGLAGGVFTSASRGGGDFVGLVLSGAFWLLYLTVFILDVVAVTWAGMWFGLSSRKESQAALKTILFVLVAPLFALILSCFGIVFIIGSQIFWILGPRTRLRAEFRNFAAQPCAFEPAGSGWLPGGSQPANAVPPRI